MARVGPYLKNLHEARDDISKITLSAEHADLPCLKYLESPMTERNAINKKKRIGLSDLVQCRGFFCSSLFGPDSSFMIRPRFKNLSGADAIKLFFGCVIVDQ